MTSTFNVTITASQNFKTGVTSFDGTLDIDFITSYNLPFTVTGTNQAGVTIPIFVLPGNSHIFSLNFPSNIFNTPSMTIVNGVMNFRDVITALLYTTGNVNTPFDGSSVYSYETPFTIPCT